MRSNDKVCVAFLWHFHQPLYLDVNTNKYVCPWVRLHAIKDYAGLALMARRFMDVRQSFNLVPSLVRQLNDYATGRCTDTWEELVRFPADALNEEQACFILDNFFAADWERMVRPHERYAELLRRRGPGRLPARRVAREFDSADLRDLQVWSTLAWFHPLVTEQHEEIRGLIQKGRDFEEKDKESLLRVQREVIAQIVPLYRQLLQDETAELSTSPFYHPILPLLCRMESARVAMPAVSLPAESFDGGDDVAAQLASAVSSHKENFGSAPVGLWPSEGSVSPEVIPYVAAAGFEWMASDEDILAASLNVRVHRDSARRVTNPEILYRPYRCNGGESEIVTVFRDHYLSDLIGFSYHHYDDQKAAAEDLLGRLASISTRDTTQPPLVCVILDGENAWEHYPAQGMDFLMHLFEGIRSDSRLDSVRIGDYIREYGVQKELPDLFSGSWIYGNFATWVGHPEKNTAWERLAQTRRDLLRVEPDMTDEARDQAWEELYAAEGSDWFWWYGPDNTSEYNETFDRLFRLHLKNVYRIAGVAHPPMLDSPISRMHVFYDVPIALLNVELDGEVTHYFEWAGAGKLDVAGGGSVMQQGGHGIVRRLYFGFDLEKLFLRLDFLNHSRQLLRSEWSMEMTFVEPSERFVKLTHGERADAVGITSPAAGGEDGLTGARAAFGRCLEVALSFDSLDLSPGQQVAFFVEFMWGGQVEQMPAASLIRFGVPDENFERIMWMV